MQCFPVDHHTALLAEAHSGLVSSSMIKEILPLVEFYLEGGISDEEAMSLINLEAPRSHPNKDKWQEMSSAGILCTQSDCSLFLFLFFLIFVNLPK